VAAYEFNAHAYIFESGLDTIEQSYAAAVSGITQEINRHKAAFYDYGRYIEGGGAPTGEWDEDGIEIWSQDELLRFTISIAEEALMTLRKAYAIAIYHHWERSARQWTKNNDGNHRELVKDVLAMNYRIDPHLDAVRQLANLLKHANSVKGEELYKSWRDVFPADFRPPVSDVRVVDWYDRISLSDKHIERIVKTVRGSGPQVSKSEIDS